MQNNSEPTLSKIAQVTDGHLERSGGSLIPSGYSIDSRTIKKGELFIALRGKNFNAHSFLHQLKDKKAVGAVVSEDPKEADIPVIKVKDTMRALMAIAKFKRSRAKIKTVAITGSNGKTSVKDCIKSVLSEEYHVLASRRSYNNNIGLSLTLAELDFRHEVSVLELGSNAFGEIRSLAELAKPDLAVITNIGNAHLDGFKDLSGVFREKKTLLDELSDGKDAFLNGDDPFLKNIIEERLNLIFFGFGENCDYRVEHLKQEENGQSFFINDKKYFIPLKGKHNLYNAAVAVAVASRMKVPPESIKKALLKLKLQPMRLERVKAEGCVFLNDSYNANPDSFNAALDVLGSEKASVKIAVVGDMLELGEESSQLHYDLGRSIASREIDMVIAKGQFSKNILSGARDAGMDERNIFKAETHAECADIVRELDENDMAILIKGSRQSRMEEVIRCFMNYCIH